MEKWLSRSLALVGALFLAAVATGPDQAFANLGGWWGALGIKGWLTIVGLILVATAALLALHRRGLLKPPGPSPSPSASSPLVIQIDVLIVRLEQASQVYAADPDGFFKLPKYAKFRMQVKEMDQVGEAVRLAAERKFGEGSKQEQMVVSAMKEEIKPYMPSDDDFFRAQINWLMRLRNVASSLGL